MEIKLNNTSFSYLGVYVQPVRTTEFSDPVQVDKVLYMYQLTLWKNGLSIIIDFTSGNAELLSLWMQYHFSKEKIQVSNYVYSRMESAISTADAHLNLNIERLKELFVQDSSFGYASFRIDDNEVSHHTLTHQIEIQDLKIYSGKELEYRKRGVNVESEKPMIISECRHLMEWLPSVNRLRLINKGIGKGHKNPSQSKPYLIFDLNYSEDNPDFLWGDALDNEKGDNLHKWYIFGTQLIDDMDINNRIFSLLKEELLDEPIKVNK